MPAKIVHKFLMAVGVSWEVSEIARLFRPTPCHNRRRDVFWTSLPRLVLTDQPPLLFSLPGPPACFLPGISYARGAVEIWMFGVVVLGSFNVQKGAGLGFCLSAREINVKQARVLSCLLFGAAGE